MKKFCLFFGNYHHLQGMLKVNKIDIEPAFTHIETSQLICSASQQTGFYMMGILAINWYNIFKVKKKDSTIILA